MVAKRWVMKRVWSPEIGIGWFTCWLWKQEEWSAERRKERKEKVVRRNNQENKKDARRNIDAGSSRSTRAKKRRRREIVENLAGKEEEKAKREERKKEAKFSLLGFGFLSRGAGRSVREWQCIAIRSVALPSHFFAESDTKPTEPHRGYPFPQEERKARRKARKKTEQKKEQVVFRVAGVEEARKRVRFWFDDEIENENENEI